MPNTGGQPELELDRMVGASENNRVDPSLSSTPARGLLLVACMDVRLDLLGGLGLVLGDAHILRNAGGRVTDDVLRSLAVSAGVFGTREVGVIHHTQCGMQGRSNDDLRQATGLDAEFLTFEDLEQSVRDDVDALLRCSWLPVGVACWGAVYDVATGELREVTRGVTLSAR